MELSERLSQLSTSLKETLGELDGLKALIEKPVQLAGKVNETLDIAARLKTLEEKGNALKQSITEEIKKLELLDNDTSRAAIKKAEEVLAGTNELLENIKKKLPTLEEVKQKASTSANTGWGWIKNQRNTFRDFKNWNKESWRWWKNAARGATIGVAWWGIAKGISAGLKKVKSWWKGLRTSEESIWEDYETQEIKNFLQKKFPQEKEKIDKLKSKKRVIAYAKRKGITPEDVDGEDETGSTRTIESTETTALAA